MALINARILFRSSQQIIENCRFSLRTLSLSSKNFNTVNNENKTTQKPPPEAEPVLDVDKLKSEVENINKELTTAKKQNEEIMDKYKRALADGENLRTRLMKQVDDAKLFGIQNFCKDLLEVADVLNRATESVPKQEIGDKNPHLKSLYEGLTMTEKQLKTVFKRHGLEQVNPLNEKFNPNFHEALFQQEVKGKDPGIVIVVSKIGYKLHDRVIRPALVGVSK